MEQSDHVEKKAICANSVYSLDDEIHSFHTRRGALITSQSLNPWPKGRSAKGPVLKGRPQTRILIQIVTEKRCAKKHIQNQKNVSCKSYAKKYANVCKTHANTTQKYVQI